MLSIVNLSKGYGDDILFSDLSFNAITGDRIALIGANGSGKTTLMDIIADENSPDNGEGGECEDYVIMCSETTCGYYLESTYTDYTCSEIEGFGYDCSICDAELQCMPARRVGVKSVNAK